LSAFWPQKSENSNHDSWRYILDEGVTSLWSAPTSADNVALPAFTAAADRRPLTGRAAIDRYLLAHSSKPAAATCGGRLMGQTNGQTDGHSNVS